MAELGNARLPAISITAGVHGDEPAPPWALLNIVADGLLDPQFAYRIWPCTNPTGYQAETRSNAEGQDINRSFSRGGLTPEAKAIITSTRDRKFALSLDLHEDFEAEGCYCYEPLLEGDSISRAIVQALDDAGCPVQEIVPTFDLGYAPDAQLRPSLHRGRVITNLREEMRHFAGFPYSIYMARRTANRTLTFESPRKRNFSERIVMHRIAVTTAIAALAKVSFAGAQKIL